MAESEVLRKGFKKKNRWRKGKYYEPIIKKAKYWPVVQLSKDKKAFIEEVTSETLKRIHTVKTSQVDILELIETSLYR